MSKKVNVKELEEKLLFYESVPEQTKELLNLSDKEYEKVVHDLRETIELSKRGSMSRRKGSTYERKVAKLFKKSWGVDLVRTPLSGGFQKNSDNAVFRGDLTNIDPSIDFKLGIECKNQKTWNLREWYSQAEEDTPKGDIPIVVFHQNQTNKDGKIFRKANDFVMISLSDFLSIVDKDKVMKEKEKGIVKVKRRKSNG